MRTFGERLQREREMRGITLEEIAEATKIGTRSLRALELEEFDKLPGGIFNKGFVRAYARFLGIDEEQAVADYLASNRESEAALAAQQAVEEEQANDELPLRVAGLWRVAIVIVLVAAVAVGGWYVYSRRNVSVENPAVTIQVPDQATSMTPIQPKVAAPTPSTSASPAPAMPKAAVPTASASAPAPATTPPPAKSGPPSGSAVQAKPAAAAAPALVVHIRAHADAWMQVTADGKLVLETILKASDERTVHAEKQVVMEIGNAGGVEISYNGKPVPPLGPEGKRRVVTFTPEGMQQ